MQRPLPLAKSRLARLALLLALALLLTLALPPLRATAAPLAIPKPTQQRALKLLRGGKAEEATAVLRTLLVAHPKSAALTTDLGYALARLGRNAEAEAAFRRSIELDPQRWYAYANLVSLRIGGGAPLSTEERDELAALLERGLSLQAKAGGTSQQRALARGGLLLALADVERSAGNTASARVRLGELRPLGLSGPLAQRAQVVGQAIEEAAEQALAGGAPEGSRSAEAWPEPELAPAQRAALLAAERLLERDQPAALHEAERLSALHPAWRAPRWLRARALLSLGRLDDGARELSALLRLDPAHAAAWRALGETLAEHGGQFEAERADEALRRALSLEPAWSELWQTRGRLLLRRGRAAEALRALERLEREQAARGAQPSEELQSLLAGARAQAAAAPGVELRISQESTPEARELLRRAHESAGRGDTAEAIGLAGQALALSPSLLDAAALRWSLGGPALEETARRLWDDAPGLLRLAESVRAAAVQQALRAAEVQQAQQALEVAPLGADEPAAAVALTDVTDAPPVATPDLRAATQLSRPWIERAAVLGEGAAFFARARLRADEHDRAGALEDLAAAVALGATASRLDEARALRALLVAPGTHGGDPLAARAREQLAAGRASEALAGLGGACTGLSAPAQPERLVALGAAHDYLGALPEALACYRAALARAPDDPVAQARLSRAAARAPLALLGPLSGDLERAASAGWPAAHLALARLLEAAGRTDEALAAAERFLAAATPGARAEKAAEPGVVAVSEATLPPGAGEPGEASARALRDRLQSARAAAGAARRDRLGLLGAGVAALLLVAGLILGLRSWRGRTVAEALRQDPALFPAVARAVAEIRHDALKHRASALSMLGEAPRPEVARALLGDRPASALVETAWRGLQQAAEGRGVPLRRLRNEPVFGPLFLDLQAAEAQLRQPAGPADARLGEIAAGLRAHGERLSALLRLGPRTRVDAALLSGWIGAVEAELRARGAPWSSPALQLQGLDLDFPIANEALSTLFANLLRNAQAAAAAAPDPRVLVRVAEEHDAAGRRLLRLDVGDSSPQSLSLEQIEARESGRGLSLVRDLCREWQGHLQVSAEAAPWRKSVSACFPVQRA